MCQNTQQKFIGLWKPFKWTQYLVLGHWMIMQKLITWQIIRLSSYANSKWQNWDESQRLKMHWTMIQKTVVSEYSFIVRFKLSTLYVELNCFISMCLSYYSYFSFWLNLNSAYAGLDIFDKFIQLLKTGPLPVHLLFR